MGIQALKSHAKGLNHKRHKPTNNTPDITAFIKPPLTPNIRFFVNVFIIKYISIID